MIVLSNDSSNTKLAKSRGKGFKIFGLTLRAASGSGYNMCAGSGWCEMMCVLEYAGHSNMPNVKDARDVKTRMLVEQPDLFFAYMRRDLDYIRRYMERHQCRVAIRLNVASDQPWEIKARWIFEEYPEFQFYDYTKLPGRIKESLPSNYQLTCSYDEKTDNKWARHHLENGHNIAMVFDTWYGNKYRDPLPTEWELGGKTFDVISGDEHDLRLHEFDAYGKIIGLAGKGGTQKVLDGVSGSFIQVVPDGVLRRTARKALRSRRLSA